MAKYTLELTPDKDGKVYLTLYGDTYEIVIKEEPKPNKAKTKE
jgi:hypothetical protein